MNMIVVWAVLAVLFFLVEFATVGMVSIWFVAGALAGLAAAALHGAVWLQIVLFIAVSVLCFLIFYPLVKRFVHKNRQATNADMVIGKTCVVTRRIDNDAGTGAVSVEGKIWTARTVDGKTVEEGQLVRADSIQGVKLYVTTIS